MDILDVKVQRFLRSLTRFSFRSTGAQFILFWFLSTVNHIRKIARKKTVRQNNENCHMDYRQYTGNSCQMYQRKMTIRITYSRSRKLLESEKAHFWQIGTMMWSWIVQISVCDRTFFVQQ